MFKLDNPLTFIERNSKTGKLVLRSHEIDKFGKLDPKGHKQDLSKDNYKVPAKGLEVVILGAGVGGMTLAYELLKLNKEADKKIKVTILEASDHPGGRSLTLRPKKATGGKLPYQFTEHIQFENGKQATVTQECGFKSEKGVDEIPYLNAGPGRIPSFHLNMLKLCKELKVALEVYIMETRSNLVWTEEGLPAHQGVNRQVANDIRGYIAERLHNIVSMENGDSGFSDPETKDNYLSLLRYFGALETLTKSDETPVLAKYRGSQRAGYKEFPNLYNAGEIYDPVELEALVNAQLWKRSFYQAEDFEWQTTSFQPVGGMDEIHIALREHIDDMSKGNSPLKVNSPATKVRRKGNKWEVEYQSKEGGKEGPKVITADFVIANMPMKLAHGLVEEEDFNKLFWSDLSQVANNDKFLEPTCKVGWQADRKLWQEDTYHNRVPIFGGISRIEHPMTQMWYPSSGFHHDTGVLTGAYNYTEQAERWGKMRPEERIEEAREGASLLHNDNFGRNLYAGISIAWQNIPTQLGGWTNWKALESGIQRAGDRTAVEILNNLRKGDKGFMIIGDQVSFLPGWQEGAVQSALEVFAVIAGVPGYVMPEVTEVPDTVKLVQGHLYVS